MLGVLAEHHARDLGRTGGRREHEPAMVPQVAFGVTRRDPAL